MMSIDPEASFLHGSHVEQPVPRREQSPSRTLIVDNGDTICKLINPTAGRTVDQRETAGSPDRLQCSLAIEDADFLEIVRDFVMRLRERTLDMQAAYVARDFVLLGQLAHWLKGTGGTAGFAPLTQSSTLLEQAIKSNDDPAIQSTLTELTRLVASIELPDSIPV